jgi:hypothetical protein
MEIAAVLAVGVGDGGLVPFPVEVIDGLVRGESGGALLLHGLFASFSGRWRGRETPS